MITQLQDNILIINEHHIELDDIKSIGRIEKTINVSSKSAKLAIELSTTKEAKIAINYLEKLLLANKHFIRCDSNVIINVKALESISVKKLNNNNDYAAKLNF